MAATKKKDESIELVGAKLKSLKIQNFRCIGDKAVEIELDDIVVLVGPNNVGKSSILRAYELIMKQGSTAGNLTKDDFPNSEINPSALPTIELVTAVSHESKPGEDWIETTDDGELIVRERFSWTDVGKAKRQGWNVKENNWSEKVPWGASNYANSNRPEPHRVSPFDSPEKQSDEINAILVSILESKDSFRQDLLPEVKKLRMKIIEESKQEVEAIEQSLASSIGAIFPGYEVKFDANPEGGLEKALRLWEGNTTLKMGPSGQYCSTIDKQGSGARRTLLWNALKIISEHKSKEGRPHVLLLDEPEICLHPNAIREACRVLYELPGAGNWQVLVTTHSPAFIDLSRDHTSIVRVDRSPAGVVTGTTIFRPDSVNFDADDKENMKLLNLFDPYVAEFFFGGRTVIVEGDTEYTAFNYIRSLYPEEFSDLQIVRARGKSTIVSLAKILNHFGTGYAILHDADNKTVQRGEVEITSPAWTVNERISEVVGEAKESVRLVASVHNFEEAFLGVTVKKEKPYTTFINLKEDRDFQEKIYKLLRYLAGKSEELPEGALAWKNISDLGGRC